MEIPSILSKRFKTGDISEKKIVAPIQQQKPDFQKKKQKEAVDNTYITGPAYTKGKVEALSKEDATKKGKVALDGGSIKIGGKTQQTKTKVSTLSVQRIKISD